MSDMGTGRRFQSHPYMVAWWDYLMAARSLSFLIQPQDGLSAELAGRKSVRRVLLDGPYGKDLHLDSCETIILIAKGIGIAGILPYVRHMTERRLLPDESWAYHYRRGLITRKIDVYWVLEDNAQQDWAADWIKELRDIDEKNVTTQCPTSSKPD
jgi:NAD(P)H-flavin reductase